MKIITQKELASLAEDAFKNADKHGFYNESTEIETTLPRRSETKAEKSQLTYTDTPAML